MCRRTRHICSLDVLHQAPMYSKVKDLTPEKAAKLKIPIRFRLLNSDRYLKPSPDSAPKCSPAAGLALMHNSLSHNYSDLFVIVKKSDDDTYYISPEKDKTSIIKATKKDAYFTYERGVKPESSYPKSSFKFIPGSNGSYQMYNMQSDVCICLDGYTRNTRLNDRNAKHEDFFILEFPYKVEIEDVEFKIDEMKILDQTPVTVISKSIRNTSDVSQTTSMTCSETVSDTSNYTNTEGIELAVGADVKLAFPAIVEARVKIDTKCRRNQKWGKEHREEKTFSSTYDLVAEPKKTTTGKIFIERTKFKLPYKVALKTEKGDKYYAGGIWEGDSHWKIKFEVKSTPIA